MIGTEEKRNMFVIRSKARLIRLVNREQVVQNAIQEKEFISVRGRNVYNNDDEQRS